MNLIAIIFIQTSSLLHKDLNHEDYYKTDLIFIKIFMQEKSNLTDKVGIIIQMIILLVILVNTALSAVILFSLSQRPTPSNLQDTGRFMVR
jgi:hypothetical protein